MKICKQTLKEIAINGTSISNKDKSHLTVCDSCAGFFRKEVELENFLLSAKDIDAPENLKHAVLRSVNNRKKKQSFRPLVLLLKQHVSLLYLFQVYGSVCKLQMV